MQGDHRLAGNNRLPQPAPGRHRTGSPGGPRPVTAGFLRKSGVCPGFLRKLGRAPTPARARRRSLADLDKCPKPTKIAAPARAKRRFVPQNSVEQIWAFPTPARARRRFLFRFGQVSKSEQAPTPTHARRHPAFAEFCKACTRPLLRENGRKDPHSSPQPADLLPPYVSAPPRHQLCGFWTVVQITHTRTREEALLENSPKVHFGTPHLHARGGDLVHFCTLV